MIGDLEVRFREFGETVVVRILNEALGTETGKASFRVYEDAATSSLLDWSPGGLVTTDPAQVVGYR